MTRAVIQHDQHVILGISHHDRPAKARTAGLDGQAEILDRVADWIVAQIPPAAILAIEAAGRPRTRAGSRFSAQRLRPGCCGSGSVSSARFGEKRQPPALGHADHRVMGEADRALPAPPMR